MKRHEYLKSALIILLFIAGLPAAVCAQSRAYAKYGPSGETIGLFNLIKDPVECSKWQVFTGTITSVRSQKRNKDVDYQLTLKTVGRLRTFAFSLGVDEIPRSDIVSLVIQRRFVKLRACETTNLLLVEEITRLQ
jgi:hypothetical protein